MNIMQVVRELEDTIALNEKRIIELEKSNAVLSDCHVADVKRIIELEKLMPSKSTFELLKENADQKAQIAELEDKLSGKSAEVQSKLVEQEVRIAELEKQLSEWVERYTVQRHIAENAEKHVANLKLLLKPKENEG